MGRTDVAARLIPAPPERVYAALVDPDALVAWLPPSGMTGRFERYDLRPGGGYRLVLAYDDPALAGTMTMTWSVAPAEGGTLVEIRADDVPDGISAADHAAGMSSSLKHLADYVTGRGE